MQNQPDKTLEERREEARRALEGKERKKQREEEERRKMEIEREKTEGERRRREEEKKKREEEVKRKREEEDEIGRKKKEAEERIRKEEKEKEKMKEEDRKARKDALLKKILPKGKTLKPALQKKGEGIKRVSPKNAKVYKTPPIRTYETDLTETVQKRKESVVKIALAEKEKKSVAKKPIKTKNKKVRILTVIVVIILLVTLNGALIFYFNEKNTLKDILPNLSGIIEKFKFEKKERPTPVTMPSKLASALIPSDNEREIVIPKEEEILQIISKEMKETSEKESIKNIYLSETVTITVKEKTKERQKISSVGELLSVWPHNIPDRLSRSLGGKFMIGIYSLVPGENFPFLILTTNSYEQTFAGMFAWEESLLNDFYNLFGIEATPDIIQRFLDKEIDGVDARMLINTDGGTVLIYSFIDKNTLIITENESVFGEILSRFQKK